jgi:hypothetical protein
MNVFAQPGPATAILFFLLFSIIWCCVIAAIACIGGWRELARSFPAEQTTFRISGADDEQRFHYASMSMGPKYFPTNYGNCLTIRVSGEGIDVKVWPMFRVLHPPLRIPWQAIQRCERETFFLAFQRTAICLENQRDAVRFYGAAGKKIFEAWSQQQAPKLSGGRATS